MRVLRKYLINGLSFGSFMFRVWWPWRKRFARAVRKRLPTILASHNDIRKIFATSDLSINDSTTSTSIRARPILSSKYFLRFKTLPSTEKEEIVLNPLYIYIYIHVRIDVTSKSLVPRSYLPTTRRKIILSFCFLFAKFDFAIRIHFRIREKGEIIRENIVIHFNEQQKFRTKCWFLSCIYLQDHGNELYLSNKLEMKKNVIKIYIQ